MERHSVAGMLIKCEKWMSLTHSDGGENGLDMNAYLRKIALRREEVPSFERYPFHLPAVASLDQMEFHPKVTYIVGENGMGKSTLLEAVAVALGFNPEGGTLNFNFATAETHSELHRYIRTVRGAFRPRDGFFFARRAITTWPRKSTNSTVNRAGAL